MGNFNSTETVGGARRLQREGCLLLIKFMQYGLYGSYGHSLDENSEEFQRIFQNSEVELNIFEILMRIFMYMYDWPLITILFAVGKNCKMF